MKRYWLATSIIVVGMYLGACSVFGNLPGDKCVYTPEKFENIVSEAGFGECQLTEDPEDIDHVETCCTAEADDVHVSYYLFENVSSADRFFFDEKLAMDSEGLGTSGTIDNFMNYKIYTRESDEQYDYLIRVDYAVLWIVAPLAQKAAADDLILALGY